MQICCRDPPDILKPADDASRMIDVSGETLGIAYPYHPHHRFLCSMLLLARNLTELVNLGILMV